MIPSTRQIPMSWNFRFQSHQVFPYHGIMSSTHPAYSTHHDDQSTFSYWQSALMKKDRAIRQQVIIPSRFMSCDFIFVRVAKFHIKHIFAFHIIKNNYFLFHPIAFTSSSPSHKDPSPSQLGLGWFDAAAPNRQPSRPDQVFPLASPLPSQCPIPVLTNFTRCQIHSCPYQIPPDSIPSWSFSPPIAGYGDR